MRAKLFVLLMVCVLSAVALLGAACSGGSSGSASSPPTAEGQGTVSGPNSPGGLVPNFLMTFQGTQYRLVQVLQADQTDDSAFTQVGQASQSDAPGDPTVYTRQGDDGAVYTFLAGTGSGADAQPGIWYRWEPAA
jgi:hypothetical protein